MCAIASIVCARALGKGVLYGKSSTEFAVRELHEAP